MNFEQIQNGSCDQKMLFLKYISKFINFYFNSREDYDWLVDDLEEALKNPEEVLEVEQDVVDSVNLENVRQIF